MSEIAKSLKYTPFVHLNFGDNYKGTIKLQTYEVAVSFISLWLTES